MRMLGDSSKGRLVSGADRNKAQKLAAEMVKDQYQHEQEWREKRTQEQKDAFDAIKCRVGLHKSDRDYGMRGLGGAVISTCERCGKTITHRTMEWV